MCVYVHVCEAAVPLWLEHRLTDQEVVSLMPICWGGKCQTMHVSLNG